MYFDDREPSAIKSKLVGFEEKRLEVGDYQIGNLIIERTSVADLLSKIQSPRYTVQVNNLKMLDQQYKAVWLLEGKLDKMYDYRTKKYVPVQNVLNNIISSLIMKHNISVINTSSKPGTVDLLIKLSKKKFETLEDVKITSHFSFTSKKAIEIVSVLSSMIGKPFTKLTNNEVYTLIKDNVDKYAFVSQFDGVGEKTLRKFMENYK